MGPPTFDEGVIGGVEEELVGTGGGSGSDTGGDGAGEGFARDREGGGIVVGDRDVGAALWG